MYLSIIEALGKEYKCTLTVFEEKKFSFKVWRIKLFARVKDVSEVIYPVTLLEAYIIMFKRDDGFRFLRQNLILPSYKIICYPLIDSTQNNYFILSSSSINNLVIALSCLTCLEDALPLYITVGNSKEVLVITIKKGIDF